MPEGQNPKGKKVHLELSRLSAEDDADVVKPLNDTSAIYDDRISQT